MMKSKTLLFFLFLTNLFFAQTQNEIQKLEDFTKIYSVVRHFHPSDESAVMKWELFAAYGVEEVLKTKNHKEFEEKIKELFLPIAPSMTFGKKVYQWEKPDAKMVYWCNLGLASGSNSETYKRYRKNIDSSNIRFNDSPVPNNIYSLQLSNDFTVNIPLIVYAEKGKTIPEGNIIRYNELKDKQFDRNIAIANFVIMWSGLRHFFPYQDEVNLNWNTILTEGLTNTFTNISPEENMFTLKKISHYFNDGHMWITYPKYLRENSFLPGIKIQNLSTTNELVVTDILGIIPELEKGDIITEIDNEDAKVVLERNKQFWSGSEQYNTKNACNVLLIGKENMPVHLTLKNGKKIKVVRNLNASKNSQFFKQDNDFDMKEIQKDILYLNLQNLTKEKVEANINYIKSFKKIILDVRRYPKKGLNGATALLNNFFWNRNDVKFMAYPKIQNPFYENINYADFFGWDIKKKTELEAKIVLLMYEGNGSYQESIPQYLKGNNYVTTIGRKTGGVNGNINKVNLLNGMKYSFTGMKVRNPDGSLFHSIGINPDIYVDDNIEDIKNGNDTFIEKAIEYLNMK